MSMMQSAWVLLTMVSVLGSVSCSSAPRVSPDRIQVALVQGDVRSIGFNDPRWSYAFETVVTLDPQQIALPRLDEPNVKTVTIKALCDTAWVSFLLAWNDPTHDTLARIGSFSDSVALQFPATSGVLPDAAMGGSPGAARPVVIHQWKAVWEEMSRGHVKGIKTFYPDTWTDLYIFEHIREGNKEEMEKTYAASVASGNPLAHTGAPVRDLEADGFGALEVSSEQTSRGFGMWQNGRWMVIIVRPLARSLGALNTTIIQYVAIAIWDGSHLEVGARKMVSSWIPIQFLSGSGD